MDHKGRLKQSSHGTDLDGKYTPFVFSKGEWLGETTWNDSPEWTHHGVGLAEIPMARCEE